PRCACCKVFGHVQDECPKNINSDVVKNMKKPSQTPRGIPVGHKIGFKPVKQAYIHVSNKNSANSSGNKKIDVELTIEANSSGSLFSNVKSSSTSTTHIIEKIDKVERLIIKGNVTLVDDEGKSVRKVDSLDDHDSEDEVISTNNDMANFLPFKKDGYGTNSLLQ
ncbi:hypothetical protein Tco_0126257, partial [Tanacetum coccineum]